MQRNFDGMRRQVDLWRESQLSDVQAPGSDREGAALRAVQSVREPG